MNQRLAVPKEIVENEKRILQLVKENPQFISVPVVAKFLGMNTEGLRKNIESGNCPFGIEWQKTIHGNKAYKISTYTFFRWYTAGHPLLLDEATLMGMEVPQIAETP